MTLTQLLNVLRPLDPSAALVFTLGDTTIGAGYHVTELIHGQMTGIDCSANVARWQETRVQLLDGSGRDHMRLGTFIGILEKSIARLPDLAEAPLSFEFSPDNQGLRRLDLDDIHTEETRITLALRDTSAVCKPAQRQMEIAGTDPCCGPGATQTRRESCCA